MRSQQFAFNPQILGFFGYGTINFIELSGGDYMQNVAQFLFKICSPPQKKNFFFEEFLIQSHTCWK